MSSLETELREEAGDAIGRVVEEDRLRVAVDADRIERVVEALQAAGVEHLTAITGVDEGEAIGVYYHFLARGPGADRLVTLEATVAYDGSIPTITDLVPGAALYERELMDMVGVRVEGHPNPEPLLLADDYDGGPPLREESR
ncbi:NADH-quinone oxidoreductase subunit C [Halococcoides cellulosivorans]|uniref:NADH-quinone oxidoreductase subunit C n=1 Tax=Halococcoides cellulosivorans TaxID=1679096 RepID=A0A2R4WYY0_9EURY|nr:NADH-quinone oxidoreductase subunit C [Halococcoides cellulosivorans]AWB26743.1 NADH-quinone oxidoreductase subunit C [Halococcoides cellulosivorans]